MSQPMDMEAVSTESCKDGYYMWIWISVFVTI